MSRIVAIVCALVAGTSAVRAEPFDAALHAQLRSNKGNFIYSPASLRIALAMVMAGARGPTQAELSKAVRLPSAHDAPHLIGYLLGRWNGLEKVELRVSNRVWVQRGHELADAYVHTLADDFQSPIGAVDFERDTSGARDAINRWVADATQDMIPSLLGPDRPSPATKMALTNAVYFRGKWVNPFYATSSREEPFYVDGKRQVMAHTMHQELNERVARVDGALVLEKSYGWGQIVIDIILPNQRDGLAAIEDAYVKGALPGWLKQLAEHRVDVALPKFAMSSAFDATWALRGLGVLRATSKRDADFSAIDGERNLYIDDVMQKAVVELDEEGARAAAATYVGIVPTVALGPAEPPPPKIIFHADHPFMFVIRDVSEPDWVLFAGRVVDPTAK